MNRPFATLVLSCILTLAACTGGSNDGRVPSPDPIAAPPSTEAPPTAPAASTAAETDRAEPDASTPVASDSVDTTSTTTSIATTTQPAPTTTLDLIEVLRTAVERDFQASETATLQAFGDPSCPDSIGLVEGVFTEEILQQVLEALATLASEGLRARANPETPQVVLVTDEPTFVNEDETRISVATGRVDAGVVYRPGDNGGPDVIVNDTVRRITAITEFSLDDGVWKPASGVEVTNEVGVTTCDDA